MRLLSDVRRLELANVFLENIRENRYGNGEVLNSGLADADICQAIISIDEALSGPLSDLCYRYLSDAEYVDGVPKPWESDQVVDSIPLRTRTRLTRKQIKHLLWMVASSRHCDLRITPGVGYEESYRRFKRAGDKIARVAEKSDTGE